MRKARLLLSTAALIAVSVADARAAEPPALTPDEWIITQLPQYGNGTNRRVTPDDLLKIMRTRFRMTSIDGETISPTDADTTWAIGAARARAELVQQILALDLDGDGVVTADEVRKVKVRIASQDLVGPAGRIAPTREQRDSLLASLIEQVMVADTDRDGRITFQEMLAAAGKNVAKRPAERPSDLMLPKIFGTSSDRPFTFAEVEASVRRAFKSADTDGDGELSVEEIDGAKKALRQKIDAIEQSRSERDQIERVRSEVEPCRVPQAGANDEVVVFGTYSGIGLSTVQIGPDNSVVTVAQVEVQPGGTPLYVALTSHETVIWQFTGAVDRVSRVLVSGYSNGKAAPRSGVVGIPKDKVTFPAEPRCLPYQSTREATAVDKARLAALVGKPAKAIKQVEKTATVVLPGLTLENDRPFQNTQPWPTGGRVPNLWYYATGSHPNGIVEIDPATVVAPAPARASDTLPNALGVARLVDEGALMPVGTTSIFQMRQGPMIVNGGSYAVGDYRHRDERPEGAAYTIPYAYRVLRQITYPTGHENFRFIVPRGVPKPTGNVGNHCVLFEETGEVQGPDVYCKR